MTSKAFFRSIQKGSVSEVKKILRERSSHIDAKDVDGKTALHFAAESGNLLITRTLISKRASVNATDSNGWTPLHCAANKAHFEVCEELLKTKNICVTVTNNDDTTALMYLVRLRGDVIQPKLKLYKRVLKLMVQRGADVNAINMFGEAPLHAACLRGTLVSVCFLLNNRADVNVLNSKQETALHWAVRMTKPDIVTVLMKYGADPFLACANGTTPMELAIEAKSENIIKIMTTKALICEESKKECAKTGYLQRHIRKGEWELVYCVLKETGLFVYRADNSKEKPIRSYDIMEVSFKEVSEKDKRGRPFVFQLVELDRNTIFAAEDQINCEDWVKLISQGQRIYKHINSMPDSKDDVVTSTSKTNKVESEEINNHLMRILEDNGNLFCADCNSASAYWMLLNFGCLVCFDCAEIHSKLNTSQVKSVHFDSWLLDDVMKLKCNGNQKHNAKLEMNLPLNAKKPVPYSHVNDKEQFIIQKYQNTSSESKASPRTIELKRILGSRISKYETIYSIFQLLQSLSISETIWDYVQKQTGLKKEIEAAIQPIAGAPLPDSQNAPIEPDANDTLLLAKLQEKTTCVLGYCSDLFPIVLAFVRSVLTTYASKQSTRTSKTLLKNLLVKFSEIQSHLYDRHLDLMFKWWLPQVVEILATLQASHDRYDLSVLINLFTTNSVIILLLMTGEYLLCHGNIQLPTTNKETPPATPNNPNPTPTANESEFHTKLAEQIKFKCKSHVESIRKLLQQLYKYAQFDGTAPSGLDDANDRSNSQSDSYNTGSNNSNSLLLSKQHSMSKIFRQASDSFYFKKLTRNSSLSSTWSQNSMESHSPRNQDSNFQYDVEDHPLVSLYNQAPNSLSSMLCSVVAEFTQQMQHNLLGVVFSGHNLVSSSGGWENIFTNPTDSLLYHLSQLLSLLESLRSKWPIISSSTPHQFLIRPIYLVKSQLEAV